MNNVLVLTKLIAALNGFFDRIIDCETKYTTDSLANLTVKFFEL